jgi:hypothetical protein
LLEATTRPGQRGVPRLYSWVDYLRLQIAGQLSESKVPTSRVRLAIAFLDRTFDSWYLLPVYSDRREVISRAIPDAAPLLASREGQLVFDWPRSLSGVAEPTEAALRLLMERGSLGVLNIYGDAVIMDPRMNLAQPTVLGTALETTFVAGMAADIGAAGVTTIYGLNRRLIQRAIDFEEAVA